MSESLAAILPILRFLASSVGAGWAASSLFAQLRRAYPAPAVASWPQLAGWQRTGYALLYAPAPARISVFALTALTAIGFSGLLALASGQPVTPALDASMAIVAGQVVHALGLSGSRRAS